MDKDIKNYNANITNNLVNNKLKKESKKGLTHHSSKKMINETDEKFLQTINESDLNSLSINKQNNNDILYNYLQSSVSYRTGKSILKNKNNINFSFNLEKKKNINNTKSILNSLLHRNISQNSNETIDYSYFSFLKKENESQDITSPINKKKTKNKKAPFLKKIEKKIKKSKSNPNKLKTNKTKKSIEKNNRQIIFSGFEDENKIPSVIPNNLKKNSAKKIKIEKNKYNSSLNLLNLKQQKYSIFPDEEYNSFQKNLTFTKKSLKKKRKKNNDSYNLIKRKKIKSYTSIGFKFDKNTLFDIVSDKQLSKLKENIVDIITMDDICKDLKQSLINIDKNALKKELHDFETNDICDAIEKLPNNNLYLSINNNPENNSNKTKYINENNIHYFRSKTKINYNNDIDV